MAQTNQSRTPFSATSAQSVPKAPYYRVGCNPGNGDLSYVVSLSGEQSYEKICICDKPEMALLVVDALEGKQKLAAEIEALSSNNERMEKRIEELESLLKLATDALQIYAVNAAFGPRLDLAEDTLAKIAEAAASK